MFSDLYDSISLLFSWRWPKAEGVITAVDLRSSRHSQRGTSDLRLVVLYEFSVGGDGPYTGETICSRWFGETDVMNIGDKLAIGRRVTVRYRPGDPSVNKLDRSVWQAFDGL